VEPKQHVRTPSLVEGVDMRTLPIGPEEAFVLTRVDGHTTETDIIAATGLPPERVAESLTRLEQLGAVRFAAAKPSPSRPPRQPPSVPPQPKLAHPAIEASAPESSRQGSQGLYDPSELDEDVDLDLARRRRILDYYYRLDTATHYELLEVALDAGRKEIRDAYFREVAVLHPDKYFGKNLGSFKVKLEKIFQRMTEAQEVLSRPKSRAEYDAYLATVQRTKRLEQAMAEQESGEVAEVRRRIESEARIAERVSQIPITSSVPPSLDPEERRRALARRLRGSLSPPARDSVKPAEVDKAAIQEHVADELRRRYEQRLSQARKNQVDKYISAADEAVASNDLVSAANALRIAVSLAPEDAELKQRFDEVHERAAVTLSSTYLDQAKYEESNKRFLEAAASYEKASRGKPAANVFDRAAACLLEGGGDLKKAGDMARKAVGLAPKQAEPRVTLARVYLGAGMKESALAEFERASQLAPEDDTIKDWIRRIKRGEV